MSIMQAIDEQIPAHVKAEIEERIRKSNEDFQAECKANYKRVLAQFKEEVRQGKRSKYCLPLSEQ
jgi:F0F1-type ATP synthase membrane subunit b/b'